MSQQQLIERYNKVLDTTETAIIERINRSLARSYLNLADELRRKYPKIKANDSLLASQRKMLIMEELKGLLNLTGDGRNYQKIFEDLLQVSNTQGRSLATELMNLAQADFVRATAQIPIEQVKYAAEEQTKYLAKYGADFADKASAAVEQGLIQGWSVPKIETALMGQLGITKIRAEMIARTASISAGNSAAIAQYKENGIEGFVWISTADDRVCSTCAVRGGNAYDINGFRPPGHVKCRCFASPFKKSWLEKGLIDKEWYGQLQADALEELEKAGGKPNYGLAQFEKANGYTEPAKPIWTPKGGWQEQPPQKVVRQDDYQGLMEHGREVVGSRKLDEEGMASVLRQLQRDGSQRAANKADKIPVAEGVPQSARGDVGEFYRLVGREVEVNGLIHSDSRAYVDVGELIINVGDKPTRDVIFHEMGHLLEVDNPALGKAASDWVAYKATGAETSLNELVPDKHYGADERAIPDKFVNEYVGKTDPNGHTEVYSIGLQHFNDPKAMKALYDADPEHFYLMVGTIKSVQQAKQSRSPLTPLEKGGTRLFADVDKVLPLLPEPKTARYGVDELPTKREKQIFRQRKNESDEQFELRKDVHKAEVIRRLADQLGPDVAFHLLNRFKVEELKGDQGKADGVDLLIHEFRQQMARKREVAKPLKANPDLLKDKTGIEQILAAKPDTARKEDFIKKVVDEMKQPNGEKFFDKLRRFDVGLKKLHTETYEPSLEHGITQLPDLSNKVLKELMIDMDFAGEKALELVPLRPRAAVKTKGEMTEGINDIVDYLDDHRMAMEFNNRITFDGENQVPKKAMEEMSFGELVRLREETVYKLFNKQTGSFAWDETGHGELPERLLTSTEGKGEFEKRKVELHHWNQHAWFDENGLPEPIYVGVNPKDGTPKFRAKSITEADPDETRTYLEVVGRIHRGKYYDALHPVAKTLMSDEVKAKLLSAKERFLADGGDIKKWEQYLNRDMVSLGVGEVERAEHGKWAGDYWNARNRKLIVDIDAVVQEKAKQEAAKINSLPVSQRQAALNRLSRETDLSEEAARYSIEQRATKDTQSYQENYRGRIDVLELFEGVVEQNTQTQLKIKEYQDAIALADAQLKQRLKLYDPAKPDPQFEAELQAMRGIQRIFKIVETQSSSGWED